MRISEKPARDNRDPVAERSGPSGLSGPASRRLPVPPRERKPALAALAVLLVLGGALATTLLVTRSGDRVSAIRIVRQVGAGQKIPPAALEEVQVARTGVDYVPWSARDAVARTYARVTLLPGTLLISGMVSTSNELFAPGKAMVGLALKPGQAPAGLQPGDHVQVVYVPSANKTSAPSRVMATDARVTAVGNGAAGGSTIPVTIIIDAGVAPSVAPYASSGEIALLKIPGA